MPESSPRSGPSPENDEINVLDLAIVFAKRKKLILGLAMLAAIVSTVISLLLPDLYTASTKILPPQQSQASGLALLAQVAGSSGLFGGGGASRNSNDVYVAMMKSRTVNDILTRRFGPIDSRNVSIAVGKDSLIAVEVDDADPKRAANLANAYVEELIKFTQVLAVTDASQRRLFFERQLAQSKENLSRAEILAKKGLERGGLVKVDDQAAAMSRSISTLRGQITAKEVEISAMRTFAADQNPELQRLQNEIEAMRRELAKVEGIAGPKLGVASPTGEGMESMSLMRDVKYQEVIFEALSRQYEMAKIEEAKDNSVIQVMDKAVEPIASKPFRIRIVVISTLLGLVVGALWAFGLEALEWAKADPRQAQRLQLIRRLLAWRPPPADQS
jgi:uncharacterized protein involved in exopolysaccharide biosynthesis